MTEKEFIKKYFKNYSNNRKFYNEEISAADILSAASKNPLGSEAIKIGKAALDVPIIGKMGSYFLSKKLADLVIGSDTSGSFFSSDSSSKGSKKEKSISTDKKTLLQKMRYIVSFENKPSLFLKYIIIGYVIKNMYQDIDKQKSSIILDQILEGTLEKIGPNDPKYPPMNYFNNSSKISINRETINKNNFHDCLDEHLNTKRSNLSESINKYFKVTTPYLTIGIINQIFEDLYNKPFVYEIKGN